MPVPPNRAFHTWLPIHKAWVHIYRKRVIFWGTLQFAFHCYCILAKVCRIYLPYAISLAHETQCGGDRVCSNPCSVSCPYGHSVSKLIETLHLCSKSSGQLNRFERYQKCLDLLLLLQQSLSMSCCIGLWSEGLQKNVDKQMTASHERAIRLSQSVMIVAVCCTITCLLLCKTSWWTATNFLNCFIIS